MSLTTEQRKILRFVETGAREVLGRPIDYDAWRSPDSRLIIQADYSRAHSAKLVRAGFLQDNSHLELAIRREYLPSQDNDVRFKPRGPITLLKLSTGRPEQKDELLLTAEFRDLDKGQTLMGLVQDIVIAGAIAPSLGRGMHYTLMYEASSLGDRLVRMTGLRGMTKHSSVYLTLPIVPHNPKIDAALSQFALAVGKFFKTN